jgi:hypothetical protein
MKRIYFYYHAESDSLWSSDRNFEEEGNPDGCTEPISKKRALWLQKELGLEIIPHHSHKN